MIVYWYVSMVFERLVLIKLMHEYIDSLSAVGDVN